MRHAALFEQGGDIFALFDGNRTHQHGLTLLMAADYLLYNGPVLAHVGLVDDIGIVKTDNGLVGGDLDNIQLVYGLKLLRLGGGGAGHAGELVIQAEIVLEGDGGKCFVLLLNVHMLLGLYGLMQTLGIAAAQHEAAGELIDDDDLPVLDNVVDIPLHDAVSLQSLIYMVAERGVFDIGQIFKVEGALRLGDAAGGERGGLGLLVHHVICVQIVALLFLVVDRRVDHLLEAADKIIRLPVEVGALVALTGDDERRPRLVYQDGVHLVHNGKAVPALNHALLIESHVVPQIVKAHLVIGAVGNVAGISGAALLRSQPVDDKPHAQPHETVHLAHPLAVAAGKIVVDSDYVYALTGQRVEIGGQDGHKGLALAGFHLGDASLMQDDAADKLHAEGLHPQHAPRRLAHGGKGLRQNVVQRLALGKAGFELTGF